jgi:hypothetical protein
LYNAISLYSAEISGKDVLFDKYGDRAVPACDKCKEQRHRFCAHENHSVPECS